MTEIELTDEQRRALAAEHGKPLDVVDRATQERYVLLAQQQYERLRPLLEQPAAAREPHPSIAPWMLQSMQAYWRELPELLKLRSHQHQWVAYHGDERLGIGRTQVELYQQAFRRGLQRGEFYVGKLEADPEGIPPWGTLQADWSLYEATEGARANGSPDAVGRKSCSNSRSRKCAGPRQLATGTSPSTATRSWCG